MNSTVESQIEVWETQEQDLALLSPLAASEAAAVVANGWHDGDRVYEVLMGDGSTFQVYQDRCLCGNERDVEPGSEVTQRRRRLAESCVHQRARETAVNVGGRCECGALKVERTNHTDSVGNVVMRSFSCAKCGASRSER